MLLLLLINSGGKKVLFLRMIIIDFLVTQLEKRGDFETYSINIYTRYVIVSNIIKEE